MRTTVTITDEVLRAARERAQQRGQTLSDVVDTALRRELSREDVRTSVPLPVFRGGTGPAPGVDFTSNRALLELLDEGRPLDQRR